MKIHRKEVKKFRTRDILVITFLLKFFRFSFIYPTFNINLISFLGSFLTRNVLQFAIATNNFQRWLWSEKGLFLCLKKFS